MQNLVYEIRHLLFLLTINLILPLCYAQIQNEHSRDSLKNFSELKFSSSSGFSLRQNYNNKYLFEDNSFTPFSNFVFKEEIHKQKFYDGATLNDGTTWRLQSEISSTKLIGIFGVLALGDVYGYYRLKDLWYSKETTKFHTINFHDDNLKYQLMDKYGHGLHAYFVSDLTAKAYRWAGVSGDESILYGSLTGWLWMLQIEVFDGFFAEWGFSWGDFLANTVGAGFSALNQLYPDVFGGLQPKMSYQTSDALKQHRYNNGATDPIDDYEGMTFWLGVNPYHYLPSTVQEDLPVWLRPLGLAVGYSAEGIANSPQGGRREIFIGLDIDLRQIPVGESNFLKFLISELNFVRLPLPAVRLTPAGIWYGLYF